MPSKMVFLIFALVILILENGCRGLDPVTSSNRDPAVFRINLDYMPRMLVFALNTELWAAYDVEYSRLYKTWKGGINFNGPMYDDRHNVQSSTRGTVYAVDTTRRSPWMIKMNDRKTPVKPEYLGYTLSARSTTIHYRIHQPGNDDIYINETPGYREEEDHTPVFTRTFEVTGMARGSSLLLHINEEKLRSAGSILIRGGSFSTSSQAKQADGSYRLEGDVLLSNEGKTEISVNHIRVHVKEKLPHELHSDSIKVVEAEKGPSANPLEEGKQLIGLTDCGACHTLQDKAIGPSFSMIAAKYEATNDVIEKLAGKVIAGGTGVWGRQSMTPHPGVSKNQAVSMVKYILSLDSSSSATLKKGLAANFFTPGVQLSRIPEFIPGQKPNLSVTQPDIELVGVDMSINREKNDFFGFDDQFVLYLSGFMNIDEPGKYQFKLKANAGARFILNGKKIADVNYSNYDYHEQEVAAELKKGLNKIRIEYYEDIYSGNLSLRWRRPGEKKYRKIPEEIFSYDPADLQPAAPGIKEIYEVNAPGFGSDVVGLHPSFDIATVRPDGFNKRLSDLQFLPDGSLAVATWDSTGSIYIIEGALGKDRSKMKAHLFAKGLYEVMGLEYVNGKLYALQKWELTELNDTNGDGVADEYRAALDDWTATANFHEWAFGLIYKDGYFFFNTGIGLGGNGTISDTGIRYVPRIQTVDRGKTLKVNTSDWTFEAVAHGYKAPNGIGFGVDGEIFTTDNEGHMVPTNKLMHVPQRGYPFFGNDEVLQQLQLPVPQMKQPVLWMPESELSNSPSQPVAFKLGPFTEGQMVFGDVHHGGLHRVFVEKVNGEYQGAIFRFTQGLEAGINRLAWGADGNLYMAGLGAGGDFGHYGQCCGLQRLSYNGKAALDMISVKAKANGMEITFTEPLRPGDGVYTSDYSIQQFWYETADEVPEGGVKNDIENLNVRTVNVSPDRKKIFIEISGMKKEHVVYIKMNRPFISEAGRGLWAGEAWYTLNNIPQEKGTVGKAIKKVDNQLLAVEQLAGWKPLFGSARKISGNGSFVFSDMDYENFELECDWKTGSAADGGIYYHLPSDIPFSQLTLSYPEMQLADEESDQFTNSDPTHLTGAVLNVIGPRYKISKPGMVNHFRLVVRSGQVEHWLNGIRVAEYDTNSAAWKQKWKVKMGTDFLERDNGRIAFVVQRGTIEFKNVRIREL